MFLVKRRGEAWKASPVQEARLSREPPGRFQRQTRGTFAELPNQRALKPPRLRSGPRSSPSGAKVWASLQPAVHTAGFLLGRSSHWLREHVLEDWIAVS